MLQLRLKAFSLVIVSSSTMLYRYSTLESLRLLEHLEASEPVLSKNKTKHPLFLFDLIMRSAALRNCSGRQHPNFSGPRQSSHIQTTIPFTGTTDFL